MYLEQSANPFVKIRGDLKGRAMSELSNAREVEFKAGRAQLQGTLTLPLNATATIVFAHGSGSSRFSRRNIHVAELLNKAGFGTLLFDLLTKEEEALDALTGHLRFDVDFLADRLIAATAWLIRLEETKLHQFGYFGASTGAAAALTAAAELPRSVRAIVSRGGRPDLATNALVRVEAPTLLIVGGRDVQVLDVNRAASNAMRCERQIEIVPNAGHLFEEPGALDTVAQLAADWFTKHFIWQTPERASTAS
jgi:putative phosphoribosyl transferase